MSNRVTSGNRNEYRNSSKPHQTKQYLPKNPNSRQTLSNSYRSVTSSTADSPISSTTRTASVSDNTEIKTTSPNSANFVIYLPQDEAVASGLGSDYGGLDPVESQRVVDSLNQELSSLLKLRPKDFWKQVATDESLRAFLESNSRQTLSNSYRSVTSSTADSPISSTTRTASVSDNTEIKTTSPNSANFVIYLPQDEAVASGLGSDYGGLDPVESQRVVDSLNQELSSLLKLRPKDFWKQVATDESLRAFLESFLKYKRRWYDFPYRGARGIVAGVIVGESELCRRVFMVLYRISSNRDPGAKAADTLSSQDHAALLQEKKLLDLPKLLDICAIYYHENEDLTRKLVMNAIKAQPYIEDEFPSLMSHFIRIVQTMYLRCSASLEVLLSSDGQDQGFNRLHLDYLEVMDFINDAVVTMDSFVNAYKQAAVVFSSPVETSSGNEEMITMLGKLHDTLLPSFQKAFHIILPKPAVEEHEKSTESLSNIFISLKMLSTKITKFCWRLLYLCYLSDEAFEGGYSPPFAIKMFPANVEDPIIRADILIQSIRDFSGGYSHVPVIQTWGTLIQNIEKNYKLLSRIEFLTQTGWMSMDNEQIQFLVGITTHPLGIYTNVETSISLPGTANVRQADEDSTIMESKISQIKELFPDYGKGFLLACLEAYNHNPEEVIQRILEGTLHDELQSLDISLEASPLPKSALSLNKNDKGKGILVDSSDKGKSILVGSADKGKGVLVDSRMVDSAPFRHVTTPTVVKNQAAVSSSSSSSMGGRFVRKNTGESPDFEILNSNKEKELAKTEALISQQYEDEYDDSFDDLGLSVQDSGLDEPETLEKPSDSDKWNSRKQPQYYVKDGKNYSYKVAGSVAVANYNESKLINLAQKELIHGLGQGGNKPVGIVQMQTNNENEQVEREDTSEVAGRGFGRGRGRGRQGFVPGSTKRGGGMSGSAKRGFVSGTEKKAQESNDEQDGGDGDEVGGGRGGQGNMRGGGGRRGRGRNQFRKDRAMSKHLSGLPGHFN